MLEKISIESRLYGSIVRASSQHVRANCNSRNQSIVDERNHLIIMHKPAPVSYALACNKSMYAEF